MARAPNPYAGTYAPSVISMRKADVVKGLSGIKIKSPNKHMTTAAYKAGLKKVSEEK